MRWDATGGIAVGWLWGVEVILEGFEVILEELMLIHQHLGPAEALATYRKTDC